MTPVIFNQPIGNHPSETWLREIADMEHENGETTACVFQAAPPVRPSAPSLYVRALTSAANPAQNAHPAFEQIRLHRPDEQVGQEPILAFNTGES